MSLPLLLIVIVATSGCSMFSSKSEEAPKPIELGPAKSVDTPETALFIEARKLYEANLFAQAQAAFQELKDGYPFGRYAEYSELKIGDTHFYRGDYLTASMIYSEFSKQHPSSDNVPYSLLQLGRSYNLQYSGRGRDMEPLQKARQTFLELIKKHPHSIYLSAADKYLRETEKKLISHEELVADYYKEKGFEKAALARMERATELQSEFDKNSKEIKSSTEPGLTLASAVSVPKLHTAEYVPAKGLPEVAKVIQADLRVSKLICNKRSRLINIFMNKVPTNQELTLIENSVKFDENKVTFTIPKAWANPAEMDCFEDKDLITKEDGTISVATNGALSFFNISSPARLVVALEK